MMSSCDEIWTSPNLERSDAILQTFSVAVLSQTWMSRLARDAECHFPWLHFSHWISFASRQMSWHWNCVSLGDRQSAATLGGRTSRGVTAVAIYLLLHAALQQHGDAGFDGEGDFPAANVQVLPQRLAKRRLLRPRLCNMQRPTVR